MENLLKDMGKRIFDRRKQLNMTQETLLILRPFTPISLDVIPPFATIKAGFTFNSSTILVRYLEISVATFNSSSAFPVFKSRRSLLV